MDRDYLRSILVAPLRYWWLSLLVLALVMAGDYYYTTTRQPTYLARSTLIISPSESVPTGNLVYSIDALGRGRVVGTYAEVLGSEVVHQEVLGRLGFPTGLDNPFVIVKASSIADTAVIQVTAESPDPEISAQAANLAGEVGIERMLTLYPTYNLSFLTRAVAPTVPYRPDPIRNYSLGLLFGLALALVAAHLFDCLRGLLARSRRSATEAAEAPAPAAVQPRPLLAAGQGQRARR